MQLAAIDWWIVGLYFLLVLAIGAAVARKAGRNPEQFFLSGRNMPWWLLGISMVATTFSTDTPNLVTDIVRQDGVAGNWVWWAFLLTGMLTVFVYAKLWRRAGVMTDLEFYEIRYGGKPAAFLRGFRALYLGVFFNVMIMATVTLAAIKISGVLLGLGPVETVLLAGGITVLFSTLGGFRGVVLTDLLLFVTAMGGSIAAAVVAIRHPDVGGLTQLFAHPEVSERLSIFPDMTNMETLVPLLVIPLAVQWWAVWYPGAEPGGGGYIAQRMLAARNESEATSATLLFNMAHYALRPWPWILVGLASIVVFPTIDSLQEAFPNVALSVLGHDMAYAAMLTFLPTGLLGLVTASLAAAYMSTISTHLNWGSSYVVHDFWRRFVEPRLTQVDGADSAGADRRPAFIGWGSAVILLFLAMLLAAWMGYGTLGMLPWLGLFAFVLVLYWSWRRFVQIESGRVDPDSVDRRLVRIGRVSTVVLMVLAALLALWMEHALQAFQILLQIGAGTGLLFILRWFWWRINAWSEITAMVVSLVVAIYLELMHPGLFPELPLLPWQKLLIGVSITTVAWIAVTYLTRPVDPQVLRAFVRIARPGGPGWRDIVEAARLEGEPIEGADEAWNVPQGLLAMLAGSVLVYAVLFGTGMFLYGEVVSGLVAAAVATAAGVWLIRLWPSVKGDSLEGW